MTAGQSVSGIAGVGHEMPPGEQEDSRRASRARVRDYWLGGRDHYRDDRSVGDELLAAAPWFSAVARLNSALLRCAITAAAGCGIRQFLHLDCGMPATLTTQDLVDRVQPDARVVHLDRDPVVLAHARALLRGPRSVVVEGGAEDLVAVVDRLHQDPQRRLVAEEPVAVLVFDVFEHLDDETILRVLGGLRSRLAAGSVVTFTHLGPGRAEAAVGVEVGAGLYRKLLGPLTLRGRQHLLQLLAGWEVLPPGLVEPSRWPDLTSSTPPMPALAGVLRLPAAAEAVMAEAIPRPRRAGPR